MQEDEPLLTAEGKNANIELTETSLRINEYKKRLVGYNKSKIDNAHEIPREVITRAEASQGNFYVFPPEGYPGVDYRGFFQISYDEEYRQGFENIADEIGLQGRWYEDNTKLSHIGSYESEELAARDVDRAAKRGWKPLGSSATDGHINIGRTLARGLIFGASRTKGKTTVTYERTPEWLAANGKAVSQPVAPTPQPNDDPLQKLKQLKGMLDAGLIDESEYNAKKTEFLSKM
jgi:hypothetical protein